MPLIKITTNVDLPSQELIELQKSLATDAAELVGKRIDYVMTACDFVPSMTFGGTEGPTAYVEFKNIGTLDAELTQKFSDVFCSALKRSLAVDPERVYIEFQEEPRHHWGWNHKNFA